MTPVTISVMAVAKLIERLLLPLLCLSPFLLRAQAQPADSVQPVDSAYMARIEQLMDSAEEATRLHLLVGNLERQMLHDETSLHTDMFLPLLGGLIQTAADRKFNRRDGLFRYHNTEWQDYVPAFAPLATAYTLRAIGVESRSTPKRMLTANALSLALAVGTSQLLKHTTNELRPNGRNRESMPSGHVTMAFLSATILHREYGHHSPWISVGGYTAATATQWLRLRHNAHYANDLLVGAGLGISTAHLGYFITDQIFGTGEIHPPRLSPRDLSRQASFLHGSTSVALFSGAEWGGRRLPVSSVQLLTSDVPDDVRLRTSTTLSSGIEGTCFLTSRWAVDAILRLTTTRVKADATDLPVAVSGENLNQYHLDAALRYSLPVASQCRVAFRLLAGDCLTASTDFRSLSNGRRLFRIPTTHRFEVGAGLSFDVLGSQKFVTGFSADWLHAGSSPTPHRCVLSSYWKILL